MRAGRLLTVVMGLAAAGCAEPAAQTVVEVARPPLAVTPEPVRAPPPDAGAAPDTFANLDPADDFVVGPPERLLDCDDRLLRAGVKFSRAALAGEKEARSKLLCGSPQVVLYQRGPAKIAYDIPPVLTCQMALALASFEKIVDEEARRIFGARVVRIEQLGTYACRTIPSAPNVMSEHGYANAMDIGRLTLESGAVISIYRDFDRGDGEPKTKRGAFLRVISRRAYDEGVFSHVLTPFFDRAHDNHFHLDLARFRRDGTRPQP